jgi:ATP-dependent DNA ligase
VRLFTRRGYDWTARYPLIRAAVELIPTRSLIIDGEAVYCDDAGVSVFDKLHSRAHDDHVILYASDLLELDGIDQRSNPLVARKGLLEKMLAKPEAGIRLNEHLTGDGAVIFSHACRLGLEGIVSKHRDHPYRSGPSKSWLKTKNPDSPAMQRLSDGNWE